MIINNADIGVELMFFYSSKCILSEVRKFLEAIIATMKD